MVLVHVQLSVWLCLRVGLMTEISCAAVLVCTMLPLGLACLCLPVQLQLWLLIHSFIQYIIWAVQLYVCFPSPKEYFHMYPTLAPSYFFFVCLSSELLCYTRSVTQIPVFVV